MSDGRSEPADSPLFGDEDSRLNYSTSETVHSVRARSSSGGSTSGRSQAHTEGRTEGLEPLMGEELSSVQFRPLEEQLYRAMALMVNQPQAHCLVKMPLKTVKAVKVPRVEEAAAIYHPTKDLLAQYQVKNFEKYKNQFIALRDQVEAEITDRQAGLLEQAKAAQKAKDEDKGSIEDLRE